MTLTNRYNYSNSNKQNNHDNSTKLNNTNNPIHLYDRTISTNLTFSLTKHNYLTNISNRDKSNIGECNNSCNFDHISLTWIVVVTVKT
jgi:hypothetical protein